MNRRKLNPEFSLSATQGIQQKSLEALLRGARASGKLQLCNRNLRALPAQVCHLLDEDQVSADEKWWECTPLTSLDASSNELEALPDASELALLPELAHLKLDHNRLPGVDEVCDAPVGTLLTLNAGHNHIAALPDSLRSLQQLRTLILCDNRLSEVPVALGALVSLEHLDLSRNRLAALPEDCLSRLPRLRKLVCSGNGLEQVPSDLNAATGLQELDFSANRLRTFADLSELTQLQVLNVQTNRLSHLPFLPTSAALVNISLASNALETIEGIDRASGLQVLNVKDNRLKSLPSDLARCPLSIVDASNNMMDDVPSELGFVQSLKKLLVEGNFLRRVNKGIFAQGRISEVKKYLRSRLGDSSEYDDDDGDDAATVSLTYAIRDAVATHMLDLSEAQLDGVVPDEVWGVEGLQELKLVDCGLNVLPEDVTLLENCLRRLVLERNALTAASFPAAMASMQSLAELHLAKNMLDVVPDVFVALRNLTLLDLRHNKITKIGSALLSMPQLQRLYLGFNNIADVPDDLFHMSSLEELDLESCHLQYVSSQMYKCRSLRMLRLDNNDISQLPAEMGVMEHLQSLSVTGNPLRSVSCSIIQRGTQAILEHLKNKLPLDSVVLKELNESQEAPIPDDSYSAIVNLRQTIAGLESQLDNLALSKAQVFALKKQIARERAKLIREERAAAKKE